MKGTSLTEKVSAYELSMIKISKEDSTFNDIDEDSENRYQCWGLPDIIREYGLTESSTLTTWIGFDQNNYAYTILFCLLKGCLKESVKDKDYFTKLKYILYAMGQKHLILR